LKFQKRNDFVFDESVFVADHDFGQALLNHAVNGFAVFDLQELHELFGGEELIGWDGARCRLYGALCTLNIHKAGLLKKAS